MKHIIFSTSGGWAPLILRTILGATILAHGLQKAFGWFSGFGFSNTMAFFTETVGLPWVLGFFIILLESLGAVLLILGLFTRPLSVIFIVLALGIVFTTHIDNGFFMNWFGNLNGEGYEYFVLWVGMALALVVSGGGNYALDKVVYNQK